MRERGGSFDGSLRCQQIPLDVSSPALRHSRLHKFKTTADAGKKVVEVVGEPASKLPDSLHLLGLSQLLFNLALLAHVARDLGIANQFARAIPDRVDDDHGPESRAVFAHSPA